MNIPEAKFILGAYRPDGRDAADPAFAEALALAARDPELGAWLEGQRALDRAVAGKLQSIAPPPGLRASILAGGRVSRPRRQSWWSAPVLAAAAVLVLGLAAAVLAPRLGRPTWSDLADRAMGDLASAHADHDGAPEGLAGLQAELGGAAAPLSAGLKLDLDELRRKHCRSVRVGGREVFEVCFTRDGVWYHLYAAKRSDFAPPDATVGGDVQVKDGFSARAWADARNVYALVVQGPPTALQRWF